MIIMHADTLGPESKPIEDDENKKSPRKDTAKAIMKSPANKEDPDSKPIGSAVNEPEKKKGIA